MENWGHTFITYLLSPRSRFLLENISGLQLVKKFPTFYWTRRFITAFTFPRHLSLSWANPVQAPTSHFLKIHFNIIFPPTLRSPQGSLSLRFTHQNPVHASLLPHSRYMPRPSHYSRFYHPHDIGWGVQIMKLLIIKFSPLPCYLVPLKVPIHVRVWLASSTREAWVGSQARIYMCMYIIGPSPARDTPHTVEYDSLEPEPSRTR
jgi:hypothetical protein